MDNTIPEMFLYEKRYWYPHMMPEDVAIWERFIEKYPTAYDNCQYDVPVGSIPEFDVTVNAETNAGASRLYKKKIDVVAYKDASIDIIELKPKAGASAVGQVKLYKSLWKKEYSSPIEPRAIIITDAVSDDVREFAREEGVLFVIV
jgi:hypothetical protein